MGTERILVTRIPPGGLLGRIVELGDLDVWDGAGPMPRQELLARVGPVTGLYCMLTDRIDVEVLDAAPALRVVSCMAVGVDNVDLAACTARGIPVGNTPGVLTETTADLAFALLMAAARRIVEGADYVRAGRWGPWDPELLLGVDVHGSTLGIVGMGRIGKAVARRAAGFGMKVLYHNRRPDPHADLLGAEYRSLADLLAGADHVVLLVPLTDETHHLIDEVALRAMKPTATLINVARGPVVDPAALRLALAEGWIGAAALDVTDPEPIEPDDPLLRMPNCVVIPHLGSATIATRSAMAALAVDNLAAGLRGEAMPALANPEVARG